MKLITPGKKQPLLENLVASEDLGLDILHPGGLDITQELARLCQLGQGTAVLDVASGSGESACYLAETVGARVVGIDISSYMLERARKKAALRHLEIEFAQADAQRLPFAEATFDRAVSECTICVLDKDRALAEMVRVVKPAGYVGIHDICWKQDTPEHMRQRFAEMEGETAETLAGWQALFEKVGLIKVKTLDRSWLLPTWMKYIKQKLGLSGQLKIFLKIVRLWGIRGLSQAWESGRIFQSKHTGYGLIVGQKPSSGQP